LRGCLVLFFRRIFFSGRITVPAPYNKFPPALMWRFDMAAAPRLLPVFGL
jgi:hypothetical protein